MSGNLAEFIKVFLIVFTFSGGILAFRQFMLNIGEEDEVRDYVEHEENLVHLPKKAITERKAMASPDIIDYDGMGNQGRFPSASRK
tara:strand:- start:263 stop:520 length:258 start_codon:yes stop_codon:yes gene_type:complete